MMALTSSFATGTVLRAASNGARVEMRRTKASKPASSESPWYASPLRRAVCAERLARWAGAQT